MVTHEIIQLYIYSIVYLIIANTMYQPVDDHKIYTSCKDALVRGGIRPNPGQGVTLLLNNDNKVECKMENIHDATSFCPVGMYGIFPKCFTVHHEYVDNKEAARYKICSLTNMFHF